MARLASGHLPPSSDFLYPALHFETIVSSSASPALFILILILILTIIIIIIIK